MPGLRRVSAVLILPRLLLSAFGGNGQAEMTWADKLYRPRPCSRVLVRPAKVVQELGSKVDLEQAASSQSSQSQLKFISTLWSKDQIAHRMKKNEYRNTDINTKLQ